MEEHAHVVASPILSTFDLPTWWVKNITNLLTYFTSNSFCKILLAINHYWICYVNSAAFQTNKGRFDYSFAWPKFLFYLSFSSHYNWIMFFFLSLTCSAKPKLNFPYHFIVYPFSAWMFREQWKFQLHNTLFALQKTMWSIVRESVFL